MSTFLFLIMNLPMVQNQQILHRMSRKDSGQFKDAAKIRIFLT
jgi:hypothetical protein